MNPSGTVPMARDTAESVSRGTAVSTTDDEYLPVNPLHTDSNAFTVGATGVSLERSYAASS